MSQLNNHIDDSQIRFDNFIKGRVYYDTNEDGVYTVGEPLLENRQISVNGVPTITTGRSPYYFRTELGEQYLLELIQNTGSDFARDVSILDTLDIDLDIESFQFTGSSHPVSIISHPSRVVEFFFKDIILPDSTSNEPESHGYVQYTIDAMPNLVIGSEITNTAAIIFDLNSPIITNTTLNTIIEEETTTSTKNIESTNNVHVWPNPATDVLYINSDKAILSLSLYSSQGLKVMENWESTEVDIEDLTPGVYFLKIINSDDQEIIKRIVIQ